MKRYRRGMLFLLIASLLLGLCGCKATAPAPSEGSASAAGLPEPSLPFSPPEASEASDGQQKELTLTTASGLEEQTYTITDMPLKSDAMELFTARQCGGRLLEVYRQYDADREAFSYEAHYGEKTLTIPAEQSISGLHPFWAEEEGLWGICAQGQEQPETLLFHWNWEGDCLLSQDLSQLLSEDMIVCDLLHTDRGLLLLGEDTLLRLSEELEVDARLDFSSRDSFGALVETGDGQVLCRHGSSLSGISLEEFCLTDSYKVPSAYEVWPGDSAFDLYLTSETGLYGVSLSQSTAQELLLWSSAALAAPDIFLGAGPEGYQLIQTNPLTLKNELLSLGEVPPDQAPTKTELVLAVTQPEFSFTTSDTYQLIQYFNQHSDDYHLSVAYYYGASAQETEAQVQQLKMDILTGEQIDLILPDNLDLYPFLAQELLEDLYPWLDQDQTLSREDLSPSLLQATETDGHLYLCATSYTVFGFAGPRALAGDAQSWDLAAFGAAVQEADQVQVTPFANCSGADFLYRYILYNYGHFVDEANGTCQFDCPEFRLLLELCRDSFPQSPEAGSVSDGTAILAPAQMIASFSSFGSDVAALGDDAALVGFPGVGGNGGVVQRGYDAFAMLSTSKQKAGAWEFLSFLWGPTAQSRSMGIECPARLDAMDASLARQVQEFGNLTEEEASLTREFYLGATAHTALYTTIEDIVMEESQPMLLGDKPIDETIAVIQNRTMIYLSEQQ